VTILKRSTDRSQKVEFIEIVMNLQIFSHFQSILLKFYVAFWIGKLDK